MEWGLETFSYHLAFGRGRMDIFDFIRRTADLGLDGVQINLGAGPPHWGHLGSVDPLFLKDVRAAIEAHGFYVEIDTQKTDPEYLRFVLEVCSALGAGALRTYEKPSGDLQRDMDRAVANIRQILPACADLGVRIAFENHEYETAADVLDVVRRVDSEWVGALVDTGNSMMVWEDPVHAVKTLAPYAVSSHFKDHIVFLEDGEPKIAGVTLGTGAMDCAACLRILMEKSPLSHVNLEVCYDYRAPFRRPKPHDFTTDSPVFTVHPPPYDPAWIAPSSRRRTPEEDRMLPDWQDRAVVESIAYVKRLQQEVEGE
jgi:sugar phosphate isomerase/epimerase